MAARAETDSWDLRYVVTEAHGHHQGVRNEATVSHGDQQRVGVGFGLGQATQSGCWSTHLRSLYYLKLVEAERTEHPGDAVAAAVAVAAAASGWDSPAGCIKLLGASFSLGRGISQISQ